IFTASVRRDASNIFGVSTNNRWLPLWSMGIAWNISEEPFLRSSEVDNLKLRLTYGYSGNIANDMSAQTILQFFNNAASTQVSLPAARIISAPNPELRWEKVATGNAGLDFVLFSNRIQGTLDVYVKKTMDLIDAFILDPTVGRSSMSMNVANTKSRGFDLSLTSENMRSLNLEWRSTVLFSYNNNWITKTYRNYNSPSDFLRPGVISLLEGTIAYPAYSYAWGGLNPESGQPYGVIDGVLSDDYRAITRTPLDQLVYHGSARPLYFGSVRNDFRYKSLSLSVNVIWRWAYFFRRKSIDYADLFNFSEGHKDYYQRWQSPGDELVTNVPAFEYPVGLGNTIYRNSEILMENGNHIRLQDIRLGYDISPVGKWRISRLQVFSTVNNVGFIWRANKHGLDPDLGTNTIPLPKNFVLGVSLQF